MVPGTEYIERRSRLLNAMDADSVCVIPAARLVTRSRDTEFAFRQDSDFHYLTGFPEPDAYLVLTNRQSEQHGNTMLFCLPKDKDAEIWHGRRIGPEDAEARFDMDHAFPIAELEDALVALLDGHQTLYYAQGHDSDTDDLLASVLQQMRNAPKQSRLAPSTTKDIRPVLHEMRLIKSDAELAVMQKAADISAQAHKRAMAFAQAGKTEYQLEAELHHEFAMQGARQPAYGTIVGSGDNACILHYTENASTLTDGDLVLIDAGGELEGYAADITRTFPVSGRFSEPQRQLYEVVLEAQLAAFEHIRPGSTFKIATDKAIEVLTQGLISLGILKGDLTENIESKAYRDYFMHGLGHWLGLDVHDVGRYMTDGSERPFEPGMVLTVEPGLYIAPDAEVDARWQGIGIRIEDNLVITETGYHNLTSAVPKQIDEIERLMAGPR